MPVSVMVPVVWPAAMVIELPTPKSSCSACRAGKPKSIVTATVVAAESVAVIVSLPPSSAIDKFDAID